MSKQEKKLEERVMIRIKTMVKVKKKKSMRDLWRFGTEFDLNNLIKLNLNFIIQIKLMSF